jgi:hypothetical protein
VEVVEGKETASLPVLVADSSDLGGFRQLAEATPGSNGYTIVTSFEGMVYVDSIYPGRSLSLPGGSSVVISRAGIGKPYPTPPGTFQGLQAGNQGGGTVGTGNGSTEGGSTGDGTQTPPDTSSIIQGQLPAGETPTPTPTPTTQTYPLTKFGYYVGMLKCITSGDNWDMTYISTSRQDLSSNLVEAVDPNGSGSHVKIDNLTDMWFLDVNTTAYYLANNLPLPIQITETGKNAYMAWGYWTQPATITTGGPTYNFNNKGYYVMGDVTAAASMPTTLGGIYSGSASGTVFSSAGGADYSGTFQMDVTFSHVGGTINNFNVSIGNPAAAGASYTSTTGTITGNSFNVTGGTGQINGAPSTAHSAYGSFYGPDGKRVGGVWQLGCPTHHANGNFIGSRP